MARTIQDDGLLLWEAYASAGDAGFPDHARMVFHCLTEPGRRARFVTREGDKSAVEKEIASAPDHDLLDLLGQAETLS